MEKFNSVFKVTGSNIKETEKLPIVVKIHMFNHTRNFSTKGSPSERLSSSSFLIFNEV